MTDGEIGLRHCSVRQSHSPRHSHQKKKQMASLTKSRQQETPNNGAEPIGAAAGESSEMG